MGEFDVIEVVPGDVTVVAERKRTMLLRVAGRLVAAFKDRVRKVRNAMRKGEKFYVSVAKMDTVKWEWFGVPPRDEDVWRVIAVHKERFTPVPHRFLRETLESVLREAGVKDPYIRYADRKWRVFIGWSDGHGGVCLAHRNTAEKSIWVFPYVGEFLRAGKLQRVYHTGNLEELAGRLRKAILTAYAEYRREDVDRKWKEAMARTFDRKQLEKILSRLMERAPLYVKRYLLRLMRMKKLTGRVIYNALAEVVKAQEERGRPNVTVLQAAWEVMSELVSGGGNGKPQA